MNSEVISCHVAPAGKLCNPCTKSRMLAATFFVAQLQKRQKPMRFWINEKFYLQQK